MKAPISCVSKKRRLHVRSSPARCEGADIHPLYKFPTDKETNPNFAGKIKWNFNKFLIDKNGNPIARFDSGDKPESAKVTQAIEQALK